MAKRDINSEIQARIEAFAEELSGLVKEAAVEAVQEALAGATNGTRANGRRKPAARKKAAKRATAAKRKTRGRRRRQSEAQVTKLANKVLSHVTSNDGERIDQIAAALGVATADLKAPVALLMDEKKVRRTGQRRGTKYHLGRGAAKKAA